jgi:hypothetical protein
VRCNSRQATRRSCVDRSTNSAIWRDLAVIQEIARIAERGKFDLLFVSDGLDYEQGDLPSFMCRFKPTSLISVLSAHTTRLGRGATVSTSFTEPYNVARLFASIDHISQGRAAWNVVTSDRRLIPGGSSSGAAVSVSDGGAVIGIGTDTGGSVRIPAALCGIVGFKPTQKRIPRDGACACSCTRT